MRGPIGMFWRLLWVAMSLSAFGGGAHAGFVIDPGGGVMISAKKPPPTPKPPRTKPQSCEAQVAEYLSWQQIMARSMAEREREDAEKEKGLIALLSCAKGGSSAPPGAATQAAPKSKPASKARAATAATPATPAIATTTPYLPFLGNQSAIVSALPDFEDPGSTTQLHALVLRRQADCSLLADVVQPDAATPGAATIATLGDVRSYFHQLAGLSTTVGASTRPCAEPALGHTTTNSILALGVTASGKTISAEMDLTGALLLSTADPVANTIVTTTLLANTSILGFFTAADLNGDGILDVIATFVKDPVTGQSEQDTAVILSNPDGTFQPPVYYQVAGDVTVDDFNGDGKPDIAVLSNPGITTLIGNGNGSFTVGPASAPSRTTFGEAPGQVLSGDFNGDGKKDLLANGTVYLGVGDGSFTLGTAVPDLVNDAQLSVGFRAVGDFNNDGKLDLVVQAPGYVEVLLGNGDGTFGPGVRYASLSDRLEVSVVDIDSDGNPDILVGTNAGGVYTDGPTTGVPAFQILMGRGDGTFVAAPVRSQSAGLQAFDFGDVNGDGKVDEVLVTPNGSGSGPAGTLDVLLGDGAGNLLVATSSAIAIIPERLIARDMNKDGKPDAVVAGRTTIGALPMLAVLTNQGDGSFAAEQDYALPNPVVSMVTGDFNADGLMDVAVGVQPANQQTGISGVYVLLGNADGSLAAPVQIDAALAPVGLATGDLNGDGIADLVIADLGFFSPGSTRQVQGAVRTYLGSTGGLVAGASVPTTTATNYSAIAIGDMNGDGKLDIVVAGVIAGSTVGTGTPGIYTLPGNGDGTFQAATVEPVYGTDGIGATSIALADFDKDGHPDVVLANPNDSTEMLLGRGDGTYDHSMMALAQLPSFVAAADLNGDGFPELFVGSGGIVATFGNQRVWPASAGGTSPPPVAADFALTTSSPSGSVSAGASATTVFTVSPTSGFTGTVSFSCAGLPEGATCSFSPASVTIGSGAITSTLTISTTARTASVSPGSDGGAPGTFGQAGFALALALMIPAVVLRRRGHGFGRIASRLAWWLMPVVLLPACGGDGEPLTGLPGGTAGTPAGSYNVTITAASGSTTHTLTYVLTVN